MTDQEARDEGVAVKKYELTDERNNAGLYRIRALRDIPEVDVRAGDLGGWVKGEHNLSQDDSAWVYGSALVYGSAEVYSSARVHGSAWVHGSARVSGSAEVSRAGHVLSGTGLPSGDWTLYRTDKGHTLKIGCWSGTTTDLRTMIAGDDWPEARGEQITERRPMLTALADMCDAVTATWEG